MEDVCKSIILIIILLFVDSDLNDFEKRIKRNKNLEDQRDSSSDDEDNNHH